MAELIHGTKNDLFGPLHDKEEKVLCAKDCEICANRIFLLHTGFFTNEFKSKVAQQHGAEAVCHDGKCSFCMQSPKVVLFCLGVRVVAVVVVVVFFFQFLKIWFVFLSRT
jgi:hypothetical protein